MNEYSQQVLGMAKVLSGNALESHRRLYPQWIARDDSDKARCPILYGETYQCEEDAAPHEFHLIRVPNWPDGYCSRRWRTTSKGK